MVFGHDLCVLVMISYLISNQKIICLVTDFSKLRYTTRDTVPKFKAQKIRFKEDFNTDT